MANDFRQHRAARFRNEIYDSSGHRWSGEPNDALLAQMNKLTSMGVEPGTALDVGAGEGADAVWLAQHGWHVTAIEPSRIALDRGRKVSSAAGVNITWIGEVLEEADLGDGRFDLVVAMYVSFLKGEGSAPTSFLTDIVAPGGYLLFVHHDDFDYPKAHGHRFAREDYIDPAILRIELGSNWEIPTDAIRERRIAGGGGAHQHTDLVFLARRR